MDKRDWIINLENTAYQANQKYGFDVATSVFQKYGATSPYDLSSSCYGEAFDELDFMANDY